MTFNWNREFSENELIDLWKALKFLGSHNKISFCKVSALKMFNAFEQGVNLVLEGF